MVDKFRYGLIMNSSRQSRPVARSIFRVGQCPNGLFEVGIRTRGEQCETYIFLTLVGFKAVTSVSDTKFIDRSRHRFNYDLLIKSSIQY